MCEECTFPGDKDKLHVYVILGFDTHMFASGMLLAIAGACVGTGEGPKDIK